ncbi:MAG: phosphoadenosine phosphosulfate reductase [Paenibacillus sp.]|nr:phosphoadenosine phosphosulfate reductase [Paenibacillus sp.]
MDILAMQELAHRVSAEYEKRSPEALLEWAVRQIERLTLACSFGAEDVVLLDMVHRIHPGMDIFYLDTDFHFKETYETRDQLSERYGMKFIPVHPGITPEEQAARHGNQLWHTDPDLCCHIRKVLPLANTLTRYDAWITGIRRDQSPTRASAEKVEYDAKFGLIKLNPLASWKQEDVWHYIRTHHVIYNPLHDLGYPSIGCTYCTRPVKPGEDSRAGRWSGKPKTECGLHLDYDPARSRNERK